MDLILSIATIASFVVTGAVVALNGIAPLTRTTKDDRVRDVLVFVHDKILAFLLPFLAARVAATPSPEVK